MLTRYALATLTLVFALAAGCAGPTYINIPAQEGDLAGHDPNGDVVRGVVAEAARGLMLEVAVPPPVAVVLPADATALSHADVARRIGEGAVSPFEEGIEPASTVEAREVRVRGGRGEVDFVHPGRGGMSHLTTVYLEWAPFGGWKAERVRTWQGSAQMVLPSRQMQAAPAAVPE